MGVRMSGLRKVSVLVLCSCVCECGRRCEDEWAAHCECFGTV